MQMISFNLSMMCQIQSLEDKTDKLSFSLNLQVSASVLGPVFPLGVLVLTFNVNRYKVIRLINYTATVDVT